MGWKAVRAVCICGVVGAVVAVGCGGYAALEREEAYDLRGRTTGAGAEELGGEGVARCAGWSASAAGM